MTKRFAKDFILDNSINVEKLFQKFNPMLRKAAKGRKFVQVLGEEDAYQEACLAFMETVRRAEREDPEILFKPSFPGYLRNCVINHLIDRQRHEELFQCMEFNEDYLAPCPSFEHSVVEKQYLDELEQFLIDPQIMIVKADLEIIESKIIYQFYKQERREREVAENLGISQSYVARLKQEALNKLRVHLEKRKFRV